MEVCTVRANSHGLMDRSTRGSGATTVSTVLGFGKTEKAIPTWASGGTTWPLALECILKPMAIDTRVISSISPKRETAWSILPTETSIREATKKANSKAMASFTGKTDSTIRATSAGDCEADRESGRERPESAINTRESSRIIRRRVSAYTPSPVERYTKATTRTT